MLWYSFQQNKKNTFFSFVLWYSRCQKQGIWCRSTPTCITEVNEGNLISGACLWHPQNKKKQTIVSFKEMKRKNKSTKQENITITALWYMRHEMSVTWWMNHWVILSFSLSLFLHFVFAQNIQRAEILRQIYMKIKFYKHTPENYVKKTDGQTRKNMYIQRKKKRG